MLLDPASDITPRAGSTAVHGVARRTQVERALNPALDAGQVVLLDRVTLSTYAYQVAGRGLDEREVRAANVTATGGLVPDLTLLLRLPAEVGAERALRRGVPDRMEASGAQFHARVANAFAQYEDRAWQRAHPECGPVLAVDAHGTADDVEMRVLQLLTEALPGLRHALDGERRDEFFADEARPGAHRHCLIALGAGGWVLGQGFRAHKMPVRMPGYSTRCCRLSPTNTSILWTKACCIRVPRPGSCMSWTIRTVRVSRFGASGACASEHYRARRQPGTRC